MLAKLGAHRLPRHTELALGIVAGGAIGAIAPFGNETVLLALLLVVIVVGTTMAPEVVPAILLVGPAVLHTLTYIWSGFATRGDVLANPLAYSPLLAVLFGPALVATVLWRRPALNELPFARSRVAPALIFGMILLQLLLAVRLVGTPSPIYGITKTAGFLSFSLLPALYVLLVVRNALDAKRVFNAMMVVGGSWLALLIGLAFIRGNFDFYHANFGQVLGGSNEAAGGIGARAGILLIVALSSVLAGSNKTRLLGFMVLPLAATALILSGHRDSLFATSAGVVVLLFMLLFWMRGPQWIRPGKLWIAAASTCVVVLLGGWVVSLASSGVFGPRYQDPFSSESFAARQHVQQIALDAWSTSPILGHGTGSSAHFIGGMDQPKLGVINGIYPHNVTIELLLELGVIGATIYVVTVTEVSRRAARLLWRAGNSSWPVAALLALFVQAFVASQGGADLTLQNDLWIIGAVLGAAAVAAGSERPLQRVLSRQPARAASQIL